MRVAGRCCHFSRRSAMRSKALSRLACWDRRSVAVTVSPLGRWVKRTPVSTLLRCCPPCPLARKNSSVQSRWSDARSVGYGFIAITSPWRLRYHRFTRATNADEGGHGVCEDVPALLSTSRGRDMKRSPITHEIPDPEIRGRKREHKQFLGCENDLQICIICLFSANGKLHQEWLSSVWKQAGTFVSALRS